MWQCKVPLLRPISANAPNHVTEGSIGNLSLTICLGMSDVTTMQVRTKHPPQSDPKVAKEFDVTV